MPWKPIHPSHAIERVRIFIRFDDEVPTKFVRKLFRQAEQNLSSTDFHQLRAKEERAIRLGPEGVLPERSDTDPLVGWELLRTNPSNQVLEAITFETNSLSYETADYSGWSSFRDRFVEVSNPVLIEVLDLVNIQAVSLEYVDRFLFEGKADEAAPGGLLADLESFLNDDALSGSVLWHLHRGWYAGRGSDRYLVNQNFDAKEAKTTNSVERSVQLYTKIEKRIRQPEVDSNVLLPHLEFMHQQAVSVFASKLTDEAKVSVGLKK
ncbi:MAG: TIGR04255 family protein [Shimia thalassica]|uniref:TIGR04255 family protein n=1 Tax=Shimia thalassica TaxID=1715693 RepID=UPI003296BB4C